MSEVRRQRAVITGAGDGIGRALAIQLNQRGIDLWLCDIDQARLEATKELLSKTDCHVDLAVVDCGNQVDIENWAARISAEIDELDFLFNNAGVAYGARFEDVSFDNFEWLININFWGVVWCTKAFLPLLTKSPASHLVNLSSIFGMIGVPTQTAYNAAKFAVRGFSESLQTEYRGTSLKVTCVHPGGIATNIARRARMDGEDAATVTADERDESFRKMAKTSPEKAADIIIRGTLKGKKRIIVGLDAWFIQIVTKVFPTGYQALTARLGQGDDVVV